MVVLAGLFWLQSMNTLSVRRFFAIFATTSSGISPASCSATALA